MSNQGLLSSDWMNETSPSRNELVFEHRHKEYGAYLLRNRYNRTLSMAMIVSSLAFLFFLSLPKIIEMLTPSEEEAVKTTTEVVVDLTEPPPVDETEPPPPPPPPPPVMETIKFTPPVVVDEPIEEEAPPVQEEIKVQVATETQEGTGDEQIIIPEETGNGAVEENPETPFVSVEEMPQFPGGEEALFKYLGKNINYPAVEKDAGIAGTVYVYFVINKEGKVTNAEVKRGVKGGPGLDREALRVISNMPQWSIGKQNGRPAAVQFTLPVKFVLR